MSKDVLKRVGILFSLALLLSLLSLWVTPAMPTFAANCSNPPCKAYNDWQGGESGGSERLDVIDIFGFSTYCSTGCSWIQFGMWSKYGTGGAYVFLGIEKTQTTDKYLSTTWSPGGSIHYSYLADVRTTDHYAYMAIEYDFTGYSGYQKIILVSDGGVNVNQLTDIAYVDGNELQTGYRMGASSGSARVQTFTTSEHQWLCRTCPWTWYYQTNDGQPLYQGNSTNLHQAWYIPPHLPNSQGGTWQGTCMTNCP